MRRHSVFGVGCIGALFLLCVPALPASAQGLVFPGVGPVNQSMGGTAVAAPLDAIGALYWNPGTLSGLPQSQMDFGAQMLYLRTRVASEVAPNAFGPGLPATPLSGGTRSSSGVVPLPNFGVAYRLEGSPLTFGLGVFVIGGFGVDYEADPTNPILSPPPPNGFGLGSVYSELALLQLAPAVSMQLTDRLSIGAGPTVTLARLQVVPAPFAMPDDADGNGFATFPPGVQNRYTWGGGFHAGIYYKTCRGINLGASFRSPAPTLPRSNQHRAT